MFGVAAIINSGTVAEIPSNELIIHTTSVSDSWYISLVNSGEPLSWSVTGGGLSMPEQEFSGNTVPDLNLSTNTGTAIISIKSQSSFAGLTSISINGIGSGFADNVIYVDVLKATDLTILSVKLQSNLTSIDVSTLTQVQNFTLRSNDLSSIDFSNNPNAEDVFLYYNKLTDYDVLDTPLVNTLYLYNNLIGSTELDLIVNTLDEIDYHNGDLKIANNAGNLTSAAYEGYVNLKAKGWEIDVSIPEAPEIPPVTESFPTLSNFHVKNISRARIYFNSSSVLTMSTVDGFVVSGKSFLNSTAVTINTGQLTDHYFTMSSDFTYWDNNTIRLGEIGDISEAQDTLHNFPLTHIINSILQPVSGLEKFVEFAANGIGTEGDPMSIQAALAESSDNTTYWIKAADYGAVNLTTGRTASSTAPAKFIGYKLTTSDSTDPNYYDYDEPWDTTAMPSFDGFDINDGGDKVLKIGNDNLIFKNIQIKNAGLGIEGSGATSNIVFENVNIKDIGSLTNISFSWNFLVSTSSFNIRLISCVAENAGEGLFCFSGSRHLIKDCKGYDDGDDITQNSVDYFMQIQRAYDNIITGCELNRKNAAGQNAHAFNTKKNAEHNLFYNNLSVNIENAFCARTPGSMYNVFKDGYSDGAQDPETWDKETLVSIYAGASYNLFENLTGKGLRRGIYIVNNGEWVVSSDEPRDTIASNNTFRNLIIDGCIEGIEIRISDGMDPNSDFKNNNFENCLFRNVTGYMFEVQADILPIEFTGNTFDNCILDTVDNYYNNLAFQDPINGFTFNNNRFYSGNPSDWSYTGQTGWIGNSEGNPDFVDTTYYVPQDETMIAAKTATNYYDFNGRERADDSTLGPVLLLSEVVETQPPVESVDWYVAKAGDNSDGLTPATAWNSLASLQDNLTSVQTNDVVGFSGEDEFYGNLDLVSKSGITFTSYGTGKSIIKGSKQITGFNTSGDNIWTASTGSDAVYTVPNYINARYPEFNGVNDDLTNYLEVIAVSSQTTFTVGGLDGFTNLIGATIYIRTTEFSLEGKQITAYNSGSGEITIDSLTKQTIETGDYVFANDSAEFLTTPGYWYYASNVLSIYATSDPGTIEAVTNSGIIINMSTCDDLSFSNLSFKNVYSNVFNSQANVSNIDIINNTFEHCYDTVVMAQGCSDINFSSNEASRCTSYILYSDNASNITTSSNELHDCYLLKDFATHSWTNGRLIYFGASNTGNSIAEYNHIYDIGMNGIMNKTAGAQINYNFIERHCLVLYDAAGIYVEGNATGSDILNNTIIGYTEYIDTRNNAHGIYIDDLGNGYNIDGNNIGYCAFGIYLHNAYDSILNNNNICECNKNGIYFQEDTSGGDGIMANITVSGNDIVTSQKNFKTVNTSLPVTEPVGFGYQSYYSGYAWGTNSNNRYYVLGAVTPTEIKTSSIQSLGHPNVRKRELLSEFQTNYTQEAGSIVNTSYKLGYDLASIDGANLVTNGDFSGGASGWSIVNATNSTASGSLVVTPTGGTARVASSTFSVVSGNSYLFTFDGSLENTSTIYVEVLKSSDYTHLRYWSIDISANKEFSYQFDSEYTGTVLIRFSFFQAQGDLTLDNISFEESTFNAYTNNTFFAYNETSVTKDVTLPAGTWTDLDDGSYTGTITLDPYSSSILLGLTYDPDYFVSSSTGDDENNGRTEETAWQTLTKVSEEITSADASKTIAFKKDDTWVESMTLSGLSPSQPITFTSYGTGTEPPVFTVVETQVLTWDDMGSNIWRNTTVSNPKRVMFDGVEILGDKYNYSTIGTNIPDFCQWSFGDNGDGNDYLYIYSTDSPENHLVEFATQSRALYLSGSDNLIFDGIDFQGGRGESITVYGCSDILIKNSIVGVMSTVGILVNVLSTTQASNVTLDTCNFDADFTFDYSTIPGPDATEIGAEDGAFYSSCDGGEIKNCTFKNWGHGSVGLSTKDNILNEVTNMKVYNNYLTSPNIDYGGRLGCSGNTHHNEFYNNTIEYTSVRTQIGGFNNHIHHNIIKGTTNSNLKSYDVGQGISISGSGGSNYDNIIENNLMIDIENQGFRVSDGTTTELVTTNIIRNNIIYNCGILDSGSSLIIQDNAYNHGNSFYNNDIYSSLGTNTILYYGVAMDVATFNTQTVEQTVSDNLADAPLFVGASDYHQLETSPTVNAGTTALAVLDYEGNAIPFPSTLPDIGIYESEIFTPDYYVSSSTGDDLNDGSLSAPFKTLAKITSIQSTLSGKTVALKRGDRWEERLYLYNQTYTSQLKIVAYGDVLDELPIIDATREWQNALTWTEVATNIWEETTLDRGVYRMEFDGTEVLSINSYDELGTSVPDFVKFGWSNERTATYHLYVHSTDNPNNHTMRFSSNNTDASDSYAQAEAVRLVNIHNVKFTDIKTKGGYYQAVSSLGCTDITFDSVDVGELSHNGILPDYYNSTDNANINVINSNIDARYTVDFGSQTVTEFTGTSGDGINYLNCDGGLIDNNTVKNWSHIGITVVSRHQAAVTQDIIISNNTITAPDLSYGGGIATSLDSDNIEVFNNWIEDAAGWSSVGGYNAHWHDNIFKDTRTTTIKSYNTGYGIVLQGTLDSYMESGAMNYDVDGNIIENNVFISNVSGAVKISGNNYDQLVTGNIIRNNIAYECGTNQSNFSFGIDTPTVADSNDGNTWQNNDAYSSLATSTIKYYDTYITVTAWNAETGDGHTISNNIAADPEFIVGHEYKIEDSSPCVNTGTTALSTVDYYGNARPYLASNVDIGIYESEIFIPDYYVSSSTGDDSNDGLTSDTPWQTVSKVVTEFQAGTLDNKVVAFKKGDMWEERLYLNNRTVVGEPTVFTAYGTGEKPIISALRNQSFIWTTAGTNLWTTPKDIERMLVDGTEVLRAGQLSELGSSVPDFAKFYPVATDDPNHPLTTMHSTVTPTGIRCSDASVNEQVRAVYLSNVKNLKFDGLEFEGGSQTSVYIVSGASDIELINCKIGAMAYYAIWLADAANYIIIDNCDIDAEFTVDFSTAGDYGDSEFRGTVDGIVAKSGSDCIVRNSTFRNWGHSSFNLVSDAGTVSGWKIHDNYFTAEDIAYGGGLTTDTDCENTEIYNNHIYKTKNSQANGRNNHWHHNIFDNILQSPIKSFRVGQGIQLQNYAQYCEGNMIENNLFIDNEHEGFSISGNNSAGNTTSNIIRNNIITNCGALHSNYGLEVASDYNTYSNDGNTFRNNIIYKSGITNTISLNGTPMLVATFNGNASGGHAITDNLSGEPVFVSATDYHLTENSPAVNNGHLITATSDYEGNTIPYSTTRNDIGIYESEWTTSPTTPDPNNPELITDGDMSNAASWETFGNATISGGVASVNLISGLYDIFLRQSGLSVSVGTTYTVTLDVANWSDNIRIRIGRNSTNYQTVTGNGLAQTFDITMEAGADTELAIMGGGILTTCTIDNVSLKETI